MIATTDPRNGNVIKTFEELSDEQVKQKIESADNAFKTWRTTDLESRVEIIKKFAAQLHKQKEEIAKLASLEMGKIYKQAIAEVEKCALACEYYAENAAKQLTPEKIETEAQTSYVRFDPLGIILGVMPWNFPFWQAIRFITPTILAGNTVLLKHASNVPQCAVKIEELYVQAGLPEGVYKTLLIGSSKVEMIINDDRIKGVSLTGSELAGSKVAEAAGRNLKKQVLELGGSDPFIVLEDADIDWAVEQATLGRLQNNGQSCVSAKRFVLHEVIAETFKEKLIESFKKQVVGDPFDDKSTMGPLVNTQAVKDLEHLISDAKSKGAQILLEGGKFGSEGNFFAPAIITGITKDMLLYSEEAFGPIASIYVVKSETEAIELANDTRFGLGSAIFTKDITKAQEMAEHINSGCVFINRFTSSHPHLPFGGVNKSGYGRELSEFGIREFVNVKSVFVK